MRPSLTQMERVESYVLNTLPLQEKLAFEAELADDPGLQAIVEFQQHMQKVVQRQALRSEIDLVSRQFGQGGGHFPWKWIFSSIGVAIAVTTLAGYFFTRPSDAEKDVDQVSPKTETARPALLVNNGSPAQEASSALVSTRNLFPLVDARGMRAMPFNAPVDLIAKSSLTQSAYLSVVPFTELDFLPKGFASKVSEGMPFKSHRVATGQLIDSLYYTLSEFTRLSAYNSADPREFTVKIGALKASKMLLSGNRVIRGRVVSRDGVPMGSMYLQLAIEGKAARKLLRTNRRGYFRYTKPEAGEAVLYVNNNGFKPVSLDFVTRPKSTVLNQVVLDWEGKGRKPDGMGAKKGQCFINPLSIKVIKMTVFQNTFLGTREFEQRLEVLHTLPNGQELLELYVGNLGKDLWEVDSLVATRVKGPEKEYFTMCSKHRLTNVKNCPGSETQLFSTYTSKLQESMKQQRDLEKTYCRKTNKQIEQLERKIAGLIPKSGSVAIASGKRVGEQSLDPKSQAGKLELKLDQLLERCDDEDAFLQGLIEFIDPCCGDEVIVVPASDRKN